ncbi:hypothetical protein [Enterobacter sp. R1(2018)]|uniref:hypothetical protein n=1 Tax=Enterobacter sp. R1(2018) TaxID=2447891 RepID=UPI000EB1DE3C|nr:hypothetical protein [Enterobacter sp. R1(2018)]RKQ38795.1 hypothetical protein D8M09_16400 [Enterobacter sp. R1(2018)]
MISTPDKVFLVTVSLGLVSIIASIIASLLNRKRFKEVCQLYKDKYGSLPDAVLLFENVKSLYFKGAYGIKTQFIFMPLLWNRSSILTKNDDKEFIRGLPKRIIRPFYLEAYLGLVSIVFFVIAGLLMLAIRHGWV